jgi:hypothetical protein
LVGVDLLGFFLCRFLGMYRSHKEIRHQLV